MARLVAAVGTKGNNVVSYAYEAARHSQHGVSGAYVIEINDNSIIHEDDTLPISNDMSFSAFQNFKGSVATGFITKNIAAKERSIGRRFLLDGYLPNPEETLKHPLLDQKESDPYIALRKIVDKLFEKHDLYSIGKAFSENARGVGIFRAEEFRGTGVGGKNGLIVCRSGDGWRTGWVGRHKENLHMVLQESYIFERFGIEEYRELELGETLLITDGGGRIGVVEKGKLEFDPQQISHDFNNNTVIFESTVNEIRKKGGAQAAKECADYIKRRKNQEVVVVSFHDVTRTGAKAFADELDKRIGNVRYEEFYIPERGSSAREQQANFGNKDEGYFPFFYNATRRLKKFDPKTGIGKSEVLSIIKNCHCVGFDDCMIRARNASKHHEIMKSIGIKEHSYVTMREPIIDPRVVGYLTVPKVLFFDSYKDMIFNGKITNIEQMNNIAKTSIGYDIFLNNVDNFASAVFEKSNKGYTKENLAITPVIRDMPQR